MALTCIDPRLNPLIPEALGVREEDFIWLRNAGNIITGPLSSTLRSLALACAVKSGKRSRLSATPIAWWPKQLSCSSGSVPRPGSGTPGFPTISKNSSALRQRTAKRDEGRRDRPPKPSSDSRSQCTGCSWTSRRANWWLVNGYQTFGTVRNWPFRSAGTRSAASTVIPG